MDADRILIYNMRQGDEAAWEQFIRKYYPDILKYCHFHCMDKSLAEDLTQDVFLRFFTSLSQYRHCGKAKNYLYTIARNLCTGQNSFNSALPLDDAMGLDDIPSSCVDDRLMLDMAIRRLPEEFREVILLHYYQGLKQTEVAAVLKIGLPLVKYRLKRAKDLIRKETDYEPESSA